MADYLGGNAASNQGSFGSLFKSIAILRIGTGALLLTQHAWLAAIGAYKFLWEEQSWEWVKAFGDAGLPYPQFTAPAAAIILTAVAISFTVGFLTRLFAIVFMPVLALFLVYAQKVGAAQVETAWLYLLISFTLLLFGSGAISIDKLFHIGESWASRPKKKKKW
ncbi:MAG: DoxX family protein [Verrucomicrobiota bacterium]